MGYGKGGEHCVVAAYARQVESRSPAGSSRDQIGSAVPKGAKLFQQGVVATGVDLVESGEARVLLPTGQSQKQLLEDVGPGTMLGLSESMSGERYRITAEAGEPTTAAFVPRERFLEFLREPGDFCMEVVWLLSADLHALYHKFRSIGAYPRCPRNRPLEEQLN